jgi:hypothetical protein
MAVVSEVVKQFYVYVEGLNHAVAGKITKSTIGGEPCFTWHISHHYKPTASAGVYYPSEVTTSSLEDTECLFRAYAESFVADHQVVANQYF